MTTSPTVAMVDWARTAELPMPLFFYESKITKNNTLELKPMRTTSLQPTNDFYKAIRNLEACPEHNKILEHIEHASVSNLVIHGATSSVISNASIQTANSILGTTPQKLNYNIPQHATILSSDQSTGVPRHTRLTVRQSRYGKSPVLTHPQQIMSFGNNQDCPPHQVSRHL